MRKARYDLKQVICPNASTLGYSIRVARPGYWVETREGRYCRVLGRIAESDGSNECAGYLSVIALYTCSAALRWLHPCDVNACYEHPPAQLFQWLTGPDWVKSPKDIARIIAMHEHGTLQEQFIVNRDLPDQAYNARPEYVAQFILKG